MKTLIENYRNFDRFLKDQIIIGFFIHSVWALVVPLVYKLQGLLWTTTLISIYLVLMKAAGTIVPLFRNTPLKKVYKTIMILNVAYAAASCLYFYNQNLFLWTEVILSIAFAINSQLLHISWDLYVIKKYKNNTFGNYKYCATFRDGIGGMIGYSLVAVIYCFLNEKQSMTLFIGMMSLVFLIQLYNYNKHYKDM